MASPVNVAAPLASVVAVALLSVAPAGPDAITAVTTRSAPPAGLPAPSRTWSTGWWGRPGRDGGDRVGPGGGHAEQRDGDDAGERRGDVHRTGHQWDGGELYAAVRERS